jgi:hypothetical protein
MRKMRPHGRLSRPVVLLATVVLLVLAATGIGLADITGETVNLSSGGSTASDHFGGEYDLTAGDITLSFTYDATGMVDDAGAHAWAELGVRSNTFGYGVDFNPYWRQIGEAWTYPATTVDLLADQDIDIGDVTVVLDGDHLDVTYHLDGGWCMTSSHFAVATDPADLPQTRKGVAIPGQFPYGDAYDPCATGDVALAPIPLADIDGYEDGDSLFFAAHAAVIGAVAECAETVWQIGDVETKVAYPESSPLFGLTLYTNYADEFNWGDPADPYTAGPNLTVEMPAFANPFVVGVDDDSEFPYNSNASVAWNYATDIDVQWDGQLPFGGALYLSWSPGNSAAERKVVSDGGVLATLNRTGANQPGEGFFLNRYPLYTEGPIALGSYASGTHTINFQQTMGDGTFWDWIRLVKPCERYESGWGEGTGFRGANWSMYFSMVPTLSPILAAGSGVWLATDYHWGVNTFDPDPVGAPSLDLDDKLILQRVGGQGESAYNLPSAPPAAGNNHRFWWDRDGVDPWQNDETANTAGLYQIVITLHATSATAGTAYMEIRGLDQGFEVDGNWSTIELTPAGMTFTGDMTNLVVFYGLYGYGATHTADFESITVTQVLNP